ncbi:hypothetical protein D7D81_17150 [Halocella sp. SP3-1]|nr:hypothetical protein D7D81_17150 [Halocella sp. SP3-1]
MLDKDVCPKCKRWALDMDTLECDFCGSKFRVCSACNGSGHYDNDGSPECAGCDGTGLEEVGG